jgi:hypothetical protein
MTRSLIVFGLAAALLSGCQSDRTKAYPVRGTVVLEDGQPATDLAGGLVTFSSAELRTSANGEIRKDGTFELSTLRQGDGAVPGTYEVSVSAPEADERNEHHAKRTAAGLPYVCSQPKITVEAKTNDVKLTVRRATAQEARQAASN